MPRWRKSTASSANYKVRVRTKPRYIIEDLCVGCLECIEACVFKNGEDSRRVQPGAEQAQADLHPVPPGGAAGGRSSTPKPASSSERKVQEDLRRGVRRPRRDRLPAGNETRDDQGRHDHARHRVQDLRCQRVPYYGYGTYPNVYTALEVERLVNAAGPTGGEIVLRDGRNRRRVGIIHCVGSRDENTNRIARGSAACIR